MSADLDTAWTKIESSLTVMELGERSQVSVHLTAFFVSCTMTTLLSLSYPSSAISSQASFDPSGENVKPDMAP